MKKLQLKICGMKDNTAEVAELKPDYLGFIFYEGSPRNYVLGTIVALAPSIKKVGVFVNSSVDFVLEKVKKYHLDLVQLHGDESSEYCASLREKSDVSIWKVFSVKDRFDFSVVSEYENSVAAFLFDTKGEAKGGNGITFNWEVLKDYPSKKPFVLSGGIGLEEVSAIKELVQLNVPIMAVDVNSKFEDAPGLKNIQKLKKFKELLATV